MTKTRAQHRDELDTEATDEPSSALAPRSGGRRCFLCRQDIVGEGRRFSVFAFDELCFNALRSYRYQCKKNGNLAIADEEMGRDPEAFRKACMPLVTKPGSRRDKSARKSVKQRFQESETYTSLATRKPDLLLTKPRFKKYMNLWEDLAESDASQEFEHRLRRQGEPYYIDGPDGMEPRVRVPDNHTISSVSASVKRQRTVEEFTDEARGSAQAAGSRPAFAGQARGSPQPQAAGQGVRRDTVTTKARGSPRHRMDMSDIELSECGSMSSQDERPMRFTASTLQHSEPRRRLAAEMRSESAGRTAKHRQEGLRRPGTPERAMSERHPPPVQQLRARHPGDRQSSSCRQRRAPRNASWRSCRLRSRTSPSLAACKRQWTS